MQLSSSRAAMRFAPYELRGLLGRGGMGQVYRAWDPRLHREVALKVLHDSAGADAERVRRFAAEARAASALNHPNILAVFDADVDGQTPFIVSELVDGESLREEIGRGPLPLRRLLDLGTQIADGLADAHAAGIVHRDMKPENVMITRAGRAKILDFGLTRATGLHSSGAAPAVFENDTVTEPGLLAGTVPYMSPEQARGLAADFTSDQFALGLILYEMATGQVPFRRGTPAETLDAIVAEEPVPLHVRLPQSPLMLWWIIERCLAKTPDARYASTSDLYRDLRALRDRLPEAVARDRNAAGGQRTGGATIMRVSAVATAMVAAVGLLVLSLMVNAVPAVDLTALQFRALTTDPGYEGLPALSPDGQVVAYASEVDGVLQIFTRRIGSATSARVTGCPYDCRHPFWAPDGKRIYYVSLARQREGIWSIGATGGTPELAVENATRAAISPDGRSLAFLRDEDRADIVGTGALWLSTPEGAAPWSPHAVEAAARRYEPFGAQRFIDAVLAFSPDGTRLGVCGVPGTGDERMWQFWVVTLPGGQPARRLQWWEDAGPRISSFAWLEGGREIVLGVTSLSTPGSHLWIADLDRDRAWPLTQSAASELYPSTSARGGRVVFTAGEPDYDLLQIQLDGRTAAPLVTTPHDESDPALSADGRLLTYVTNRSGQDEIWRRTMGVAGSDTPLVTQGDFGDDRTVMLSGPSFSPDGHRIAYQRNGFKPRWPLRIWTSMVAGGASTPLVTASYDGLQSAPTWSPDGQWIAFAQWRNHRWELAKVRVGSGDGPVVLRTDGIANATPHWSPAGGWITWETEGRLLLVSPDGAAQTEISQEQWLVHTWSADGNHIFAIKETDDLHLLLVRVDVSTRKETALGDLGASPAVNNPVKGLALVDGGRAIVTSIVRPRGDLWMLDGIRRRSLWSRAISLVRGER